MTAVEHNVNSLFALSTIPANTEDGRRALTRAVEVWVSSQVTSQWQRALQSFENASYLLGNHVTRYFYDAGAGFGVAAATGTPVLFDQSDTVAKVVDNRLPRAVEAMAGLLTEVQPSPRVTPNSDSPEDEDAAALSEIVLGLVYERPVNMPAVLSEAAQTAAIFDGVIAETTYASTDELIETPRIVPKRMTDAISGEEVDVPVQEGTTVEARRDARVDLWTPLHVTPDPGATRPSDLTWVARSTFEDVDAIRAQYEQNDERTEEAGFFLEKGEPIPEEAALKHPLFWYTRLQDLLATPQYTYGGGLATSLLNTRGSLPNQTLFTVIDVRPSGDHPKGRTLVLAGGKLLYAGPARAWSEKYPWRWHPYSFWSWFNIPGKFFGMAMLTELLPLQKRINAIDNLLQKNREYIAIGQWWIPKHSKVKLGSIGGLPGKQYEYTDVAGLSKPERVKNDALPSDLYEERAMLVQAIDRIASTGALDDQIAQSAARAGVILDFLRGEKLRNKGPMIRSFESFVESISQNLLIEMQLNLEKSDPALTERIRLAARDYSFMSIKIFTGASLRDHHAVKIDIASELRHSPEAAEQRATEFFQFSQGQVSPAERAGILEAMRLTKFVKSEQDATLQKARRMISRITSGMVEAAKLAMPPIEDVNVVLAELQRELLSDRSLDYPKEVKEALFELFDLYAAEAAARAQAAAMAEAMANGNAPAQLIAKQKPQVITREAPPAGEGENAPA